MMIRMPTRLDEAWANLAPRERNLILIGLLVLMPIGLYFYFWQPLSGERERLRDRVAHLRVELAQLRADGEDVKRLRGLAPIRGAQTLEATARLAASRFQLGDKLGEVSARGSDRLVVTMDGVAFEAWLRWVGELGVQGVALSECKVEALPEAGLVRARATLLRSAS